MIPTEALTLALEVQIYIERRSKDTFNYAAFRTSTNTVRESKRKKDTHLNSKQGHKTYGSFFIICFKINCLAINKQIGWYA